MNRKVLLLSVLMVSMCGYAQKNQTKDSLLQANEDRVTELQTVEVMGRARKDYNSNYSFSASKIALKNMEITQAVSTVTKELFADRQAFRLGDVLKNVSGVSTVSFYNHYAIRGVTQSSSKRETRLINGMRTTMVYYNQPLSSNIERVEVIKGPASLTFSNTDPGGSVNIITKKPLSEPRREISLTTGSFKTIRGVLDLTGPLDKKKQFLYRLNVGYENSGSFRDLQFKKAYLVSPSFSFVPNEKTSLNVELVYNNDRSRLDRGQPIFGRNGSVTDLNSTPISTAIGATNDYYNNEQITLMGSFVHRFTDKISLNLAYLRDSWIEDAYEHRTSNFFAVDKQGQDVRTMVQMQVLKYIQKLYTDNINAYFNTNFNLGPVKNKMVFGYDFIRFEVAKDSEENAARGFVGADGKTIINTYDPTRATDYSFITMNGIEMPKPNVPHFDIVKPVYAIGESSNYTFTRLNSFPSVSYVTHGAYLQNQMEWNKFIFNFGLRQEWYIDYQNYKENNEKITEQKKLLKRFGLMYKALENLNVYGSYVEGYMPQTDARVSNPNAGGPFKPLTSDMIEFGIKSEWLKNRLKVNLAYFNITQRNILMNANDKVNLDLLTQRGKQRNSGFEVDVIGKITPEWQLNMAYSYIDAKILEDEKSILKGQRKENTPKHSFSLWNRYDFTEGILKDFGIGAGFNYVGDKIAWYDRNLIIPEYTLVDLAAYYKINNVQLAVNVNNVFNKKYWLGAINYTRLYPGTPSNIMLNVRYNF